MIDVAHQISSIQRTIGTRVLEAGEARVATLTRVYDSDIDDVWEACTSPERIPRWFLPVEGELRLGGRYQLIGNAGGVIEACEPPHRFAATWEMGDEMSWIEVTLSPEPDGRTRFRLEHVAHVDDERWLEYGPGAVGVGWDGALMGLTLHLESGGKAVDPAEVMAWQASEDGREFMTRSGNAWYDATVAAGDDPVAARAAADRTIAAYTAAPD